MDSPRLAEDVDLGGSAYPWRKREDPFTPLAFPPFVPALCTEDDTANLEEHEKPPTQPAPASPEHPPPLGFRSDDLPSVGWLRSWALDTSESGATGLCTSAESTSMEKQLHIRSKELQETQDKCHKMEQEISKFQRKMSDL
ncbi:hypothetical protein ANANG_G00266630 [Anguilla anguilla]|uniref:Uncharacterized protein n=1 Tax=Anguilla anguilla TaxID=7936 RepID=A0A9D3LQ91_ANGAN|nr:hypothetical protein ANANG_G00266630 [Anguilla anguilla]